MTGMQIHPRFSWKTASSTDKQEDTEKSISATLAKARAEGRSARFWLTVVPLTVSCVSVMLTMVVGQVVGVPFVTALAVPASTLIFFTMLPTDKTAIKVVNGFTVLMCFVSSFILLFGAIGALTGLADGECYANQVSSDIDEERDVDCGWVVLTAIRFTVSYVACMCLWIYMVKSWCTIKDAGPMLATASFGLGSALSIAASSAILLIIALIGIRADGMVVANRIIFSTIQAVCGYILMYPTRPRDLIRTFLLSRQHHSMAASIAGFLGGHSPEEVQKTAQQLFRAVTLDKVKKVDMMKSEPDPELLQHTTAAKLGLVDAFLSHSWHDDSELKWDQLQAYREDFKQANNGQEPLVWIDKYCLDQNNLKEGLMCLPVFLAGCNSLLVLAGTTYPRRLWCVMELFIFLIMGGTEDAVDLRLVCNNQQSSERAALVRELEEFDARAAQCTVQEDEDRMLGAIAGAFGDLDTFSADVRRTLLAILSRGGSAAQQEVAHLRWRVSELESKLERANVQSAQYAQQVQLLEKRVADIEARFDNRNAAV